MEQLAESVGINLDADMLGKVAGAAQRLIKDVDRDNLGDSVKDVMNNANIKEMLKKTTLMTRSWKKEKICSVDCSAARAKNKSKRNIQMEPSKFEGSFFYISMVIPCSFDMTMDDPISNHQSTGCCLG